MSDHRGRSRRTYYDDDLYYEPKPRHRSLGRQALEKIEDAMSNLGLDTHHSSSSSRALTPYRGHHHHHHHDNDHHRDYSGYYDDDYSHHRSHHSHRRPSSHHTSRRYHSVSPTRTSHRGRHSTRRDSHYDSSRSRSRWGRGIEAAVDAAAIEAFRLRKEKGLWTGAKGGRIATAAVSAGVIGAASQRRRESSGDEGGRKGALGSALGGLVVNRLVNGPRKGY